MDGQTESLEAHLEAQLVKVEADREAAVQGFDTEIARLERTLAAACGIGVLALRKRRRDAAKEAWIRADPNAPRR